MFAYNDENIIVIKITEVCTRCVQVHWIRSFVIRDSDKNIIHAELKAST